MYSKGGNMLHTLRQIVNDDEKWREILRGLNKEFYHQTVTTEQIENYITNKTGIDLEPFFNQYLRDFRLPVLEYAIKNGKLSFRWSNCVKEFNMPVKVKVAEKEIWLTPATRWNEIKIKGDRPVLVVDPDFYVASLNITGN